MSTPLKIVSLTGFVAGQSGSIDLTPVSPSSNPSLTEKLPTLIIYNESGCGLRLSGKDSGFAADLPAGGWIPFPVPRGESQINFTVAYVIANAVVSSLMATWYDWNEEAPIAALGNSPIQGGSINSNLNTLINNGESTIQTIISDQPAGVSSPILLYKNDGTFQIAPKAGGTPQQIEMTVAGGGVGQGAYVMQFDNNLCGTDGNGFFTALGFKPTGAATPPIISSGAAGNINFQVPAGSTTTQIQSVGIFSVAPVTMLAGHQETGHHFQQFVPPSTVAWTFWVTFKCILPTPPTSITLSGATAVNCVATTGGITTTGFRLILTPSVANTTTSWDGDWTTVGN